MRWIQAKRIESGRRGAILVLAALMLIIIFAFAALTIDLGYMSLTATQLQNAADAAALAAIVRLPEGLEAVIQEAQGTANSNHAGGNAVGVSPGDVELGRFDVVTREFTPGMPNPNAVRVTARVIEQPYFVAPILGKNDYQQSRSAVAMLNPRDIAFVVDLSGSMNDDTEPCWASDTVNARFASQGYPTIGSDLAQQLYNDLGFGDYPGPYQYVGQPLGVGEDWYSFANMTADDGPLTQASLPANYRIDNADAEAVRKQKAYSWIIDQQLAVLMPNARPVPSSSNPASYAHYEKYLDYVLPSMWLGSWEDPDPDTDPEPDPDPLPDPDPEPDPEPNPSPDPDPGPPPPPPSGSITPFRFGDYVFRLPRRDQPRSLGRIAGLGTLTSIQLLSPSLTLGGQTPGLPRRGSMGEAWVPDNQDPDRIYHFNNPNKALHPQADGGMGYWWVNYVGYASYTQFLLDWGRDRTPEEPNEVNAAPGSGALTMLSVDSPWCPRHNESTPAGVFSFPPSEQPMHAVRRALIAALKEVVDKNEGLAAGVGDQVSIITFDAVDEHHAPRILHPLTPNYHEVMESATNLQAVSDIGNSTATEHGLALARQHLRPAPQGGAGRTYTTKVIVLCSDGVPNVWSTSPDDINSYITTNPSGNFYPQGYHWYNGALTQAAAATAEKTKTYGVGMGLGADLDFMDRVARMGKTDEDGLSPRGTGNPADYEQRLTEIFQEIINKRGGRLVR